MARKSRKNINTPDIQPATLAPRVYRVGGYVRLSVLDKKKKGDSIENQQAIIAAFIEEHPEFEFVEFYTQLSHIDNRSLSLK